MATTPIDLDERIRDKFTALKAAGEFGESEFTDPDAVRWIERNFYVPELNGPLRLGEYQKRALRQALSVNERGLYEYSTVIWSDIKKSIKSTLAAAVALWKGFQTEWGQIYAVANDLKQADSRVGYYMRRAVELNPKMRQVVKIRNYKIELPNRATIESIPIDPSGEAGSNADMVVFSELWGATGQAAMRMWTEMTLSPTKFGRSLRWVESYAGYEDTSLLLWNLYVQAVKNGERLDEDLEIFENRPARMFALWNTRPRLPWQTTEYYAQEEAALAGMPEEFNRVHRNQWASGSAEPFLEDMGQWDKCEEKLPPLKYGEPLIAAADAGWKKDSFGLLGVGLHPTRPDALAVRVIKEWVPEKNKPLDFDLVEAEIEALCGELNILSLHYDPTQLHQMMTRLRRRRIVHTKEFQQAGERAVADRGLLDLVQRRGVAHDGDLRLRRHVANADRHVSKDRLFRIVKRSSSLPIDLCVALSMACHRGARLWRPQIVIEPTTVQRGFR